MRVLLLNDTGLVGGAERCLIDMLGELDGELEPLVACPPGPLQDAVGALGVPVVTIRGTAGSLRLHPWHTPRAVAELSLAAVGVRRLAARERIDLIHANTLRSCLVAAAARCVGGPPYAAFVHDALPPGRVARTTSRIVRSTASVLFANSAFSADRFGIAHVDPRRRVVFNPVDLAAFDPDRHPRSAARARLELASDELVLAIVAQITPWKGQHDAVEILDALRAGHPRARLLVVGEAKFVARATRYDNRAYAAQLRQLVRERKLDRHVLWLGERADVPDILAATDVLLVPSSEEPFGRIVVEGMAMGCFVAATAVGGPAEVITHRVDGLLLEPRRPSSWASAIGAALSDPAALVAMRSRARATAQRFDRARFAHAVLDGYRAVED